MKESKKVMFRRFDLDYQEREMQDRCPHKIILIMEEEPFEAVCIFCHKKIHDVKIKERIDVFCINMMEYEAESNEKKLYDAFKQLWLILWDEKLNTSGEVVKELEKALNLK